MKKKIATILFLAATVVGGAGAAQASCSSLWYERNSIYKDAGYCFKTTRAIRAFGNAGCSYDDISDVPLSARQRGIVSNIVAQERRMGCGD